LTQENKTAQSETISTSKAIAYLYFWPKTSGNRLSALLKFWMQLCA